MLKRLSKKTLIKVIGAMGLMVFLLVNCGGLEPALSQVTLKIFSPENREEDLNAMNRLIDQFEAKYPNVKVEYRLSTWEEYFTKIQVYTMAGTLPDIIYSWAPATGGLYLQNLLLSLNDVWEAIGKENVPKGIQREVRAADGTYFAVPLYGYLHGLYYRADWFNKKGLEPPQTMEEFLRAAEIFTEEDHYGVILYNRGLDAYYVMDFMRSNGAEPIAADGSVAINSPETIEVLDMIKKINDNQWTPEGWTAWNMDDAKLPFLSGKGAMKLDSTSFINTIYRDAPQLVDKLGIVPVPAGKGKFRGWAGNAQWAITKTSKYPEVAKNFLKFFFQPKIYKEYMQTTVLGFIPLYRPVAEDPSFLKTKRIRPVARLYKGGIEAGMRGGPIIGAGHGPNVVTYYAYQNQLYSKMGYKIYQGETPEDIAAWAAAQLKDLKEELE